MATSLSHSSPHQSAMPMPNPSMTLPSAEASPAEKIESPQPPAQATSPMRLALTALATLVMLAALFLLQGCGRGEDEVADAAAAGPVVIEAGAPQVVNTEAIATLAVRSFAAGQVVTAAQALALFPDAAAGLPVLEVYDGGAAFTVLEPGLDKSVYPIVADGASWVRVRAGDGLAGWINAAALQ